MTITNTAYVRAVQAARAKVKGYIDNPSSLLSTLKKEVDEKDVLPFSEESELWYQRKIQTLSSSKSMVRSELERSYLTRQEFMIGTGRIDPGSLFFFRYPNPQGRLTLPYYDEFPLVVITTVLPNGFSGLNLHYLPPRQRRILLEFVLNRSSIVPGRIAGADRLLLDYSKVANIQYAQGCFKRYLANRINTRLMMVPIEEWEAAINLPVESFVKASTSSVWADTIAKG